MVYEMEWRQTLCLPMQTRNSDLPQASAKITAGNGLSVAGRPFRFWPPPNNFADPHNAHEVQIVL
jgi:hypothetical protein